tara:strand:- start:24964 stop:25758 length:795 start_codon:yes stop_codon:yes gene_type:complete
MNDNGLHHNYQQGVSELNVVVLENLPPKKIFQNSDFSIVLQLDNQAAYPVTNGVVNLLGIDSTYYDVHTSSQSFQPLEGRSIISPNGDTIFLDFDASAKELYQNAEKNEQNYFIKVQYDSKMQFSDTICINTDLYNLNNGGCLSESTKSYSGQGAPIAISRVEQITNPGSNKRIEFRFFIENRGSGKILKATLTNSKLGTKEMPCIFQGMALHEFTKVFEPETQQVVLVCSKEISQSESYQTTLSLSFDYVYELSKQERLTLVK